MNGISTAGISFKYAPEVVAGSRPTSGYTRIFGCKSIPDFNSEPSQLETTTFDNLDYKSYCAGLKDIGGAKAFGFNNTKQFRSEWAALMTAYETAKASGLAMWFEIKLPDDDAFYISGEPSELGLSAMSVDSVIEIDAYITIAEVDGYAQKSATLAVAPTSVTAVVGTNSTATLSNRVGTCTATSSNVAVATVSVSSNTVTITPVDAGSCVVVITDGTTHESIPLPVTVTAS